MIKNGRPYSNENGYVDDGLITSRSDDEIQVVKQWIADNIKVDKEILQNKTSYGLKHLLQHDTGIYLTNNEFKDAMMIAGYHPINPNNLNWEYRIALIRNINNNQSPFFEWAKQYKKENSPIGDFVNDMIHDFNFPVQAEHDAIESYLNRIRACDSAKEAFEKLWKMYIKEN